MRQLQSPVVHPTASDCLPLDGLPSAFQSGYWNPARSQILRAETDAGPY